MKRNSFGKYEVVLSISQATISPQLLEIVKCFKLNNVRQYIFIMADDDNSLLAAIKALNVPYQILPSISRFEILQHIVPLFSHLLTNRPKTFIASGQYATFSGIPLAYLFQVRNRIYVRHHSNFHHKNKLYLGVALDRLINHFATKIVAVSQTVRDILIKKESVPVNKIVLIHNGVDLQQFHHQTDDLKGNLPAFKIGVISRLTNWKGVEYTAAAFKVFNLKYPNSYLHIVGAASDSLSKVQDILSDVPTEKYIIESINRNVPGFLKSLDVFVHVPLEPDDEAFGLVYIEALASSTPSIFTISGVLNELEYPGRYFAVVPSRDSNVIFQKLEDYYLRKAVYEEIPADWLNQFSLEEQGIAYLKLLTI